MLIGERLRAPHEQKKISQRDIEKRTGLLRGYVSRAENDHSVPAIETLKKIARAMDVPLYQLFYDGEKPLIRRRKWRTAAGAVLGATRERLPGSAAC
jgi:transcriptional regulator with XRE-family HTH domain